MSGEVVVYRTPNVAEAAAFVAFLDARGVRAFVQHRDAASMLTASMFMAPANVEVCVLDSDAAAQAGALIDEHLAERSRAQQADDARPPIAAICEECGQSADFPYAQRGTVQTCPACSEYLDVPDTSAEES